MPADNRPPVPAPAATVILVREAAGQLQVYLLRRSQTSGFMPGSYVFPGGLVDDRDREETLWRAHVDLAPETLGERLGPATGGFQALCYGVAAVRETFEEAGVLLARPRFAAEGDFGRACERRLAESPAHGWFTRLVVSDGWVLRLSALSRWARWVTPERMPRRFDTRFFVAVLPPGQACRPDMRETTAGIWISPREALVENMNGGMPLSPPTLATLHEFLSIPDLQRLQTVLAGRNWGAPIMPRLVPLEKDRQFVLLLPWDPMYALNENEIRLGDVEGLLLPAAEPFSRVWHCNGHFRPIR
jgi:8-oxo-dGTP pyrophosphatase MutT (NUDIX family)